MSLVLMIGVCIHVAQVLHKYNFLVGGLLPLSLPRVTDKLLITGLELL